jgi:hypothetical protein
MTLPLTDGAKGETLSVYVQGTAFAAAEGTYARLTLKLNGQATFRYYRNGFNDNFIEQLEVPASPATTYRLEGVVEVHQDPGNEKTAYLSVISVMPHSADPGHWTRTPSPAARRARRR